MDLFVKQIKAFCKKNYNNGYDAVVECWDNSDIIEFIEQHNITSVAEFKKAYAPFIEHRNEVKATAF